MISKKSRMRCSRMERYVSCCLGIWVQLVLAPALAAQHESLKVKLEPASIEVPVWGALSLDVIFENPSVQPVPFWKNVLQEEYMGSRLEVVVQAPGREGPYRLPPRLRYASADLIGTTSSLEPGQVITDHLVVHGYETVKLDPKYEIVFVPLFQDEGKYLLHVVYAWRDGSVSSNTIEVHANSAPPGSRLALEHLKKMQNPAVVFHSALIPAKPKDLVFRELEALATDFPSNVYSEYARLSLAQWRTGRAAVGNSNPNLRIDAKAELLSAKNYLQDPFGDDFPLKHELASARESIAYEEARLAARSGQERR